VPGPGGARAKLGVSSAKETSVVQDLARSLRVYLLGTPRVEWAGDAVVIPRRQCRALLFRLAGRSDPVPREGLQFLFWPDMPDVEARRNLTHVLTHLRRNLPDPDLVCTPEDRVALDPERTWVDVRDFVRLCATPEPLRLSALRQAVSLYRGPFLDGFFLRSGANAADSAEFDTWNAQERYTHERCYLEALAELIAEAEAREATEEAISLVERYLVQDELAEEMHRRLMMLYVRADQRTRALRQYEHCVAVLERELGVSPLQETQVLQRSILQGEYAPGGKPAASPTAPTLHWNILPSLQTPLVGRKEALEALARGLAMARSGQGGAWLLSGEPGIGKSRLLQEFVSGLEGRATPLGVCGHEAERGLPYGPLVEALWPHTQALAQVPNLEPLQRAELARLLPDLRPAGAPISPSIADRRPMAQRGEPMSTIEPTPPAPGQEQMRLFQALAAAMLGLAARNPPLVLCLDDLHWADAATLTWLSYFARQIKHAAVMILGAYRPEEASPLAPLRTELRRQGVGHEVIVGALTPQDVLNLVTYLGGRGRVAEMLSEQLHHKTGGNPFFLLETMRGMFEAGSLRQEGGKIATAPGDAVGYAPRSEEQLPLTDSVQQAIRERLDRLDSGARQVLEAGAVLGYRFTLEMLQATSGRREEEVVDGVEILLARQLLSEQEQAYLFNHEIIRALAYHDLSSGRRLLLHRRAGEALQRLRPADVAALAWHYEQGEGGTDRAIGYLLQAGDRARGIYAYEEASQYYQRALVLLKERGETERAARVCMTLGLTAHLAMDFPRAHQAYTEGFGLWHRGTEHTLAAKRAPAPHALRSDWGDLVTLDPTVAGDAASAGVIDQLFTGLVELTPDMEVAPALARRWEVQENGCAYTFYLREDALWSDGAPGGACWIHATPRFPPACSTTSAAGGLTTAARSTIRSGWDCALWTRPPCRWNWRAPRDISRIYSPVALPIRCPATWWRPVARPGPPRSTW
jgi:DNA-binding SARP family transcriptional activator/tetratricopeptide (TPR) repeat protein